MSRRRVASVASVAAAFYVKPHVVERLMMDSRDSENSTKLQLATKRVMYIQTRQGEKAANKSMNLSSMKIDLIWL